MGRKPDPDRWEHERVLEHFAYCARCDEQTRIQLVLRSRMAWGGDTHYLYLKHGTKDGKQRRHYLMRVPAS